MEQRHATAADAELVLKLYELRREPLMRRARDFVAGFWPQSVDEILTLAQAFGTEQNAFMRQVFSYWEMAASLVLRGTLHEDLFLDNAGEMIFVYAKVRPFLAEIRSRMGAPEFFHNVEQLLEQSERGRKTLKATEERVQSIGQRMRQAAKTS
jgi:hypothetical protein